MCGILRIFGLPNAGHARKEGLPNAGHARKEVVDLPKLLGNRGPDWSGVFCERNAIIAHERLAIVYPDSGDQPLYNEARDIALGVNGEIYNHIELREKLEVRAPGKHKFLTGSDCEVLLHLYAEDGPEFLSKNEVCGTFAFVIWDVKKEIYIVGRDMVGIIPLYMGWATNGVVYVASELKALHPSCSRYEEFPPGHLYNSKTRECKLAYTPACWNESLLPTPPLGLDALRDAFEKSANHTIKSCASLQGYMQILVGDGVIDKAQWTCLREFLAACPPPEPLDRSLTASYWTELQGARPSNVVEALIQQLLCHPDITATVGDVGGAEWWWQDVDHTDQPKVYHTDRNVWMGEGQEQASVAHPVWSSVMYLCSEGGATAVFGDDQVVAVTPCAGRYLLFPGDRAHGVLHSLEPEHANRITLLINWWPQRPPGISELPEWEPGQLEWNQRLLHCWLETAAPATARMCSPDVSSIEVDFAEHLPEWRCHRMPMQLRAACATPDSAHQLPPVVSVRYRPTVPGSISLMDTEWWL